ncbi:MAG: DUF4834 family protein [Prevotella sp.]|nr:DUF4834 family protein [Prevotella sp.]
MKENMGLIIFIFFVVVFILLLTGGHIIKSIKKAKTKAKKAADRKDQKYREETGRQQRQYHYSGRTTEPASGRPRAEEEATVEDKQEEPVEIHTKTATGETIIDRRAERESKKIYEDTEGEYVEFSEE